MAASDSSLTALPNILPDRFDPDPRLRDLLERLTHYYPRAIDPNLERTFRLLHDLGDPHLAMPPVIHVAGTNGKGSVLAYLRAIFESAGLTCHVMTSPHLVRFNERLVVAGEEMKTQEILGLFDEIERLNAGRETTSFELITAAGFLQFSRVPADVTLVEVGMGGRFDATNVIPDPLLSIITVISRDHTKFLGQETAHIAFEKGGIIKSHRPCIVGPQIHCDVMDIFAGLATQNNAPLLRHGHEWSFDVLPDKIMLHTDGNLFDLPYPNLLGAHQYGNAATAAMAALYCGGAFDRKILLSHIESGLRAARWPARLQVLKSGPLMELLPEGCDLVIDGGHNDSGGLALAEQAKVWAQQDGLPLHLVLGMLTTKDPRDFVRPLYPLAQSVQTIAIPDQPLSYQGGDLAVTLSEAFGDTISAAGSVQNAVRQILKDNSGPLRILVTGSLYLMGHVLSDHS